LAANGGRKTADVPDGLRIDFTSESDPLAALATFVDLATPLLARFGYTAEEKHPDSLKDWMHWNRGLHDVVRAYAFMGPDGPGVSVLAQGEIPGGLAEALIQRVAETTGWTFARPS
jgi:hypothetical protein